MNLEIIHVGLLGTNCYITWDEEKNCVVVDCGGDAQKVAQFIQEKGLTPTHLLLTHGHGDHMGGAADLKELYPQMKIVLDSKDLEMIGDGQKSMSDAVAPYARSFTPDVLVGDGDQLTCGKMEFTVLETPGHTPGSVTYLKNNELYCGAVCRATTRFFRDMAVRPIWRTKSWQTPSSSRQSPAFPDKMMSKRSKNSI